MKPFWLKKSPLIDATSDDALLRLGFAPVCASWIIWATNCDAFGLSEGATWGCWVLATLSLPAPPAALPGAEATFGSGMTEVPSVDRM